MFNLKILTPSKSIFDRDVDSVTLDTESGTITVLMGHENLMSNLKSGNISVRYNDNSELKEEDFTSESGIVNVKTNESKTEVLIFTEKYSTSAV